MEEITMSNKWCVILNAQGESDIEDITLICCKKANELYGYKYAYVIHDKDKKENGEDKTIHSHIVFWKGTRTRKTTLLNKISSFINQETNTVTIDICLSIKQSVRYLVHLDSPDKHQYLKGDIDSNVFEEVNMYLDNVDNDVAGRTLYELIKECDFDKASVAMQLGPTKYCRWKAFIEIFCK